MAIERQQAFLGQMRIDVPHLRAIESGVTADFDNLAGIIMTGKLPVVVKGYTIVMTSAIGNDADTLKLAVADSSLIHYAASESGSVFRTPEGVPDEVLGPTNPIRSGSFTPNATNFIGLDLFRSSDDTTSDIVQFLDPDTGLESPTTIALARTLNYRVVISTTEFSANPGIVPIAKVVTDAGNKVTSVVDCRHLFWRLGSGGSNPLDVNPFSWPGGRTTNLVAFNKSGDRSIYSEKDWCNAMMSRVWEIGGGENWFSPVADRNVSMTSGAVFTSTGEPFEVVSSNIHWKGLSFVFDNSTGIINEIADQLTSVTGLTNLSEGDCIYVDLDRSQNRTVAGSNPLVMQKGVLSSLGLSARPGNRWVVAWRKNGVFSTRGQYLPIGSAYRVATTSANGTVVLSATPYTPLAPVVATVATSAGLMGMAGFTRTGTGTTGDLFIGASVFPTYVDHNIYIRTANEFYTTNVIGESQYSLAQKPALKVTQAGQGVAVNYDGRIQEFESATGNPVATTSVKAYVESGGAIGMANWEVQPRVTAPTSADPARTKFGARPSRYWHTAVLVTATSALPANTPAGSGPTHTLTANANGTLTVDGVVVPLNGRVLVTANGVNNGIYFVSQAGSGGSPWILTRATDCCNDINIHQDIAVKTTSGTANTGICFVLANDTSAVPFVVETDTMTWNSTTNLTRDLVVAKWFDGSETVIASSPAYFV